MTHDERPVTFEEEALHAVRQAFRNRHLEMLIAHLAARKGLEFWVLVEELVAKCAETVPDAPQWALKLVKRPETFDASIACQPTTDASGRCQIPCAGNAGNGTGNMNEGRAAFGCSSGIGPDDA